MTIKPLADRVVVKSVEAEETTKAGIILPGIERRNAGSLGIDFHRPELVNEKRTPAAAYPFLLINGRSPVLTFYQPGTYGDYRRKNQQQESGQAHIESPLDNVTDK